MRTLPVAASYAVWTATAAAFGAPTSEPGKRITGPGPSIAVLPDMLFLPVGVSLKVEGVSVARVGVGGAANGTLDKGLRHGRRESHCRAVRIVPGEPQERQTAITCNYAT